MDPSDVLTLKRPSLTLTDLRTFLMKTTMFQTQTDQTRPRMMRVLKGDQKSDQKSTTGCHSIVEESGRMGGTSKTGLYAIKLEPIHRTLNHEENVSKAYLRLTLSVVMHH